MLTDLKPQPADKILALMEAFRADPRETKIDLGVGVYRNAEGVTPVMRAVKAAERQLVETQETKAYTGLAGDPAYAAAMRGLILGDAAPADRIAAVATPGGTGAVRQGLELMQYADRAATIWLSAPTWPNHPSIVRYLGVPMKEYRYFDDATRMVDFDGMMADLAGVKAGDLVLLHGCCHNPTGANLTEEQWQTVADHLEKTGAIPFIDIAYQGFGDGLDEDAYGTRLLASRLPEVIIAASCSKNFGVYRERTGLLMAIAPNTKARGEAQATLAFLNRQNYSFPPDHGARVVQMILDTPELRQDWASELEDVRLGMLDLREQLASALRQRTNSDRFDFIAGHRGMFSRLGATPEQVAAMREEHGIYMVGDSRMNIAGLNAATVPILADAIVAAGV
ncbi:aminotransferase class I/II-fold pyridoxal phosphate-dependent enzyme [Alphaproteobacteria bacterium GH1-50]|uniref:Aminotransferase class I/II-fold pyridoxal phosphate-dependent enzyme n=1 Tax=Kangsaoukella pontilimi TaxID=2691042 RepID=A0A7C9IG15_9RHOB|nr:amino acid aminotransferase [Kangsaoukella pontilimi]MXQ06522.1 aminotransferase class I/II-fold pyridoxal phosphate-dependent enzyme [Kangsaoukella pontilimi]